MRLGARDRDELLGVTAHQLIIRGHRIWAPPREPELLHRELEHGGFPAASRAWAHGAGVGPAHPQAGKITLSGHVTRAEQP
jgi:hypothetical protein